MELNTDTGFVYGGCPGGAKQNVKVFVHVKLVLTFQTSAGRKLNSYCLCEAVLADLVSTGIWLLNNMFCVCLSPINVAHF